jgi:hypothetical protein
LEKKLGFAMRYYQIGTALSSGEQLPGRLVNPAKLMVTIGR